MATNSSTTYDLPPLPSYELRPLSPLLPFISDNVLAVFLPIIAYWVYSGIFHLIDVYDLFPQYRLHTPAEILKRNHVSRWEVFRDVVVQQVIQIAFAIFLTTLDPVAMVGKDDYNVAEWALSIRRAQRFVPSILGVVGFDAGRIAKNNIASHPILAGLLAGGKYATLQQRLVVAGVDTVVPAFAPWETTLASALYWYIIPAIQFVIAIIWVDTWQYFWHRAMHVNKWLYTTFHSRHHRLYVPYAYGALYNHPVEGFILDILGAGGAQIAVGLSCRQTIWFFCMSTFKTVDDHSGYALPWDPFQHVTKNNAGYHDIHHQSWGIKTNFSQPFFIFWDQLLGTMWTGGDVSKRYERTRKAADAWLLKEQYAKNGISGTEGPEPVPSADTLASYDSDTDAAAAALNTIPPIAPAGKAATQAISSRRQVLTDKEGGGPRVLAEEAAEELDEASALSSSVPFTPRRSQRGRKARSGSGSLKGLMGTVEGGLSASGMRARMESS